MEQRRLARGVRLPVRALSFFGARGRGRRARRARHAGAGVRGRDGARRTALVRDLVRAALEAALVHRLGLTPGEAEGWVHRGEPPAPPPSPPPLTRVSG